MIWSFGHFDHFGRSASVAAYWGAAQGSMDQAAEHSDDRPVAPSTLVDSVDFVFSRSKQIWGPCTTAWVIGSVLSWAKMVKLGKGKAKWSFCWSKKWTCCRLELFVASCSLLFNVTMLGLIRGRLSSFFFFPDLFKVGHWMATSYTPGKVVQT